MDLLRFFTIWAILMNLIKKTESFKCKTEKNASCKLFKYV